MLGTATGQIPLLTMVSNLIWAHGSLVYFTIPKFYVWQRWTLQSVSREVHRQSWSQTEPRTHWIRIQCFILRPPYPLQALKTAAKVGISQVLKMSHDKNHHSDQPDAVFNKWDSLPDLCDFFLSPKLNNLPCIHISTEYYFSYVQSQYVLIKSCMLVRRMKSMQSFQQYKWWSLKNTQTLFIAIVPRSASEIKQWLPNSLIHLALFIQ